MNEQIPANSEDMLKLLQNAKKSLGVSYNEKKISHQETIRKANVINDEMLRIEGAIQQIDIFIKQLEGKL
jgi:hypothetical protein